MVILPALIIGIEREKQLLAEMQLSQYRDQLEHTVESRTAELTAANQQLQQKINDGISAGWGTSELDQRKGEP